MLNVVFYYKHFRKLVEINTTVARMDNGKSYELLRYCDREVTRKVAGVLEWVISGEDRNPCLHCTAVKTK